MDRRQFLQAFGAGVASLSLPAFALPDTSCKIVGIGGAGCNLVVALRASNVLSQAGAVPDYVCVDLGPRALRSVEVANDADPALTPIKTLMLAPFGAGGRVNAARAACLRHRDVLAELLTGADMVALVAGLGGGTGTAIAPIMVRLASATGALTVAAVVTPFDYEGARNSKADTAIDHLHRVADKVMAFSNQEWANSYRDDTPLFDVFAGLDRHIANQLHSVIFRLNAPPSRTDHTNLTCARRTARGTPI